MKLRHVLLVRVVLLLAATCASPVLAKGAGGKVRPAAEAGLTSLAEGNNAFACEMYQHLAAKPGNHFFSPYSISMALGMTYAGAEGDTEAQMAKVLRFSLPENRVHASFKKLGDSLNPGGKERPYQLSVANALWGQKGYKFLDPFLGVVNRDYGGGLRGVDFAGNTEEARKTINTWVEDQTQEKIKDLIPRDLLTPAVRLVLTNAIYFKGDWASQFDKKQTSEQRFSLATPKGFRGLVPRVRVPMMRQKGKFGYLETPTMQVLEMPYEGGDLAMMILLPRDGYTESLVGVEKSLSAENLKKWASSLRQQEVVVSLPRFKTAGSYGLKKALVSMGMTDAFSDAADFSGMDGTKDLFISAVLHKAFVDVNEEGTEAAAATAVVMQLKGISRLMVFKADHPFLFLIRHERTGSVLFMGRMMNPKLES